MNWLEFAKNYFSFLQECWGHGHYEVFRSYCVCLFLVAILCGHGHLAITLGCRERFLTVSISPTLCLPSCPPLCWQCCDLSPGEDQTSLQGMHWHGCMGHRVGCVGLLSFLFLATVETHAVDVQWTKVDVLAIWGYLSKCMWVSTVDWSKLTIPGGTKENTRVLECSPPLYPYPVGWGLGWRMLWITAIVPGKHDNQRDPRETRDPENSSCHSQACGCKPLIHLIGQMLIDSRASQIKTLYFFLISSLV